MRSMRYATHIRSATCLTRQGERRCAGRLELRYDREHFIHRVGRLQARPGEDRLVVVHHDRLHAVVRQRVGLVGDLPDRGDRRQETPLRLRVRPEVGRVPDRPALTYASSTPPPQP